MLIVAFDEELYFYNADSDKCEGSVALDDVIVSVKHLLGTSNYLVLTRSHIVMLYHLPNHSKLKLEIQQIA